MPANRIKIKIAKTLAASDVLINGKHVPVVRADVSLVGGYPYPIVAVQLASESVDAAGKIEGVVLPIEEYQTLMKAAKAPVEPEVVSTTEEAAA